MWNDPIQKRIGNADPDLDKIRNWVAILCDQAEAIRRDLARIEHHSRNGAAHAGGQSHNGIRLEDQAGLQSSIANNRRKI